jgi:hypothetical protein
LLLANVGANPVVAHVSVDYTVEDQQDSGGGGDDARKNSTKTAKHTVVRVKDLTIEPGDVQRVELSDALGGVGQIAESGVDIAYDAAPGSLIGQLISVDQSGDYSFEVPIKDPDAMNEMMESIYPWTLENGTATVLHLKNTTDKTVGAGVLIRFAGGTYDPGGYVLQPYQTIAVDIQKLKDSKKPDVLGHTLPSDATHGQLAWFMKIPYTMIGRAEWTDVAAGIARSYSCTTGCCRFFSDTFQLGPNPMSGAVGSGGQFTATKYQHDCVNNYFTYPGIPANSWSSDTPSVATVNGTGYTTFTGPGQAHVTAHFTDYSYTWDYQYMYCYQHNFTPYLAIAPVNVCGYTIQPSAGFSTSCDDTLRQQAFRIALSSGDDPSSCAIASVDCSVEWSSSHFNPTSITYDSTFQQCLLSYYASPAGDGTSGNIDVIANVHFGGGKNTTINSIGPITCR